MLACAALKMTTVRDKDAMFDELNSIQPSLSKNNQNLIPTLIKLFGEFRECLIGEIQQKFDASVAEIKSECLSVCKAKDAKIGQLQETCLSLQTNVSLLQDKLDATEAYERRDTIILSGGIPPLADAVSTKNVAINIIREKFKDVNIEPNDISVAHRLQSKPSASQSPKPPNIYVKLVRRDLKQELIMASKKQPKQNPNKVFVNESLTRQRSAVLQTLLRIKRSTDAIKGVTSVDGQVYAYTPSSQRPGASQGESRRKDIRHCINSREALQKFCCDFVKKPLDDFVDSWPAI